MRRSVACRWSCLAQALVLGCRSASPAPASRAKDEPPPPASAAERTAPAAGGDAAAALEKELQRSKLRLPPRGEHVPRLAFGRGVVGRLGEDVLEVFDQERLELLASVPLQAPRALLGMADGALLAVGGAGLIRWEAGQRPSGLLPRPVLLPGSELFADAQQPDAFWVLDRHGAPPRLSRYRVGAGDVSAIALPEQTLELAAEPGGAFGVTREGVWLYLTPPRASRFAPSGAKLPGLQLDPSAPPTWALPSRRLDQSTWLDSGGQLTRALVAPTFKRLATARVVGYPHAAEVGDEGRLLAVVVVSGDGPRFELQLFDAELAPLGRAQLPGDAPDGSDDWVKRVTRNQEVAVAPRAGRVAVGGPDRLAIFDAQAQAILSINYR
jgi:hypothetical protein